MPISIRELDDYSSSHQHIVNEAIHLFCVPAIYWAIVAFLYTIPLPGGLPHWVVNWAVPPAVLVSVFYFRLAPLLGVGMSIYTLSCLAICFAVEQYSVFSLFGTALTVFVIAWILQFVGHALEGKRPSFFQDIQFLLIGPAWTLSKLIHSLGLKY